MRYTGSTASLGRPKAGRVARTGLRTIESKKFCRGMSSQVDEKQKGQICRGLWSRHIVHLTVTCVPQCCRSVDLLSKSVDFLGNLWSVDFYGICWLFCGIFNVVSDFKNPQHFKLHYPLRHANRMELGQIVFQAAVVLIIFFVLVISPNTQP